MPKMSKSSKVTKKSARKTARAKKTTQTSRKTSKKVKVERAKSSSKKVSVKRTKEEGDLTKKRKGDHVDICINKDINYSYNYFDDIQFVHDALTDLNFEDLDTSAKFINHDLKYPFMITAMTGGYPEGGRINKKLAKVAEKFGLAFGLGSQRAMIEKPELAKTYQVRDVAPSIPVVGNIGAAQLLNYSVKDLDSMVKDVDANYLAVHLNTLQELIQPEGDRNFRGVLDRIKEVSREVGVPVIVKETGAGINGDVALRIVGWGSEVKGIDVSGTGGTSWAKVEGFRGGNLGSFGDWGYPTPLAVYEVSTKGIFTIGSGGVRNGLDAAKVLSLGANVAGAAGPFIRNLSNLESVVEEWILSLKRVMMLTNSPNLKYLKRRPLFITGKLADLFRARGIPTRELGLR